MGGYPRAPRVLHLTEHTLEVYSIAGAIWLVHRVHDAYKAEPLLHPQAILMYLSPFPPVPSKIHLQYARTETPKHQDFELADYKPLTSC